MIFKNKVKGYWVPAHVLTAIAEARGWGGREPRTDRIEQIILLRSRKKHSWVRRVFPF